ncbi:cell pattern formation-associated protein stuA, partial [Aspergillus saccharolyticus JOP 1030-1]
KPLPPSTEKLELPSISQVHTRGPVDIPWYNHHAAERPLLSGDKLPALSLPTASQAISGHSYRASYDDAAAAAALGSSNTSARTSLSGSAPVGSDTRSPPASSTDLTTANQSRVALDASAPQEYSLAQNPVNESYYQNQPHINSMNQTQPYMDVHSSHLSSGQPYASHAATAGGIAHYPQYHQQPPVLQPASSTYGPASSYAQYAYPGGVSSSQPGPQPPSTSLSGQVPAQLLPLPAVTSHPVPTPSYGNSTGAPMQGFVYDPTGQIAPPGSKPRVTATLWEDEGSLCYQVEAKGVCVARREDNAMINGTKLLNVAGMTRGRRDGILKSEKLRHVVKIGPMHLKGVWIPFDRALEFANKEKITDLLYPLFVHNIGGLLYHPTNQNRTNLVVQESQQRRMEGSQAAARTSQGPQPSTLHHHHHSLQAGVPSHIAQPPTVASQQGGRPGLDRAHTFPTPPASASSLMGITNSSNSYDWNNQAMTSGVPNSQPLSIDTALSNARSMPTTPATTPPGNTLQGMQSFQGQSGYDSKPYYSAAPPSHPHYASQSSGMAPYGQTISEPYLKNEPYMKNEMGPPSSRTPGAQAESESADVKSERYAQSNGHVSATGNESVGEHEPEYVQHDNAGYNTGRGSYTYTTNPSVGSLAGDHSQLAPEIAGSPTQPNGSGRMTPRTSGGPPPWGTGYSTPPRPAAASSLYNIVSDTRGTSNTGATSDNYSVSNSAAGYATALNVSLGSNKRMREDDEVDRIARPDSRGPDYESKRRKTLSETSVGGPVGGVPLALQPMKAGGAMSRRR